MRVALSAWHAQLLSGAVNTDASKGCLFCFALILLTVAWGRRKSAAGATGRSHCFVPVFVPISNADLASSLPVPFLVEARLLVQPGVPRGGQDRWDPLNLQVLHPLQD